MEAEYWHWILILSFRLITLIGSYFPIPLEDFVLIKCSKYNYIHNWSLQPFSQDYDDLASHTTYVMCINFIHEWRNRQFKVDSEVFWDNIIYFHSYCQKSAEYFVLMSNLWYEPVLNPFSCSERKMSSPRSGAILFAQKSSNLTIKNFFYLTNLI